MGYYVRKISRPKWPDEPCNINALKSDAIADIRTQGNDLSVWKIDNLDQLDDAALALAGSSKTEKVETITVVWIDEKEVNKCGIEVDDSQLGDTIITDLASGHRNFSNLTYGKLGDISNLIMKEIYMNCCRRYTRGNLRESFKSAFDNNKIDETKCMPKLLDDIKRA